MCKEIPNLLTRKIPIPPHPNPLPRGERGCIVVGEREMGGERKQVLNLSSHPHNHPGEHHCHDHEEKSAHPEEKKSQPDQSYKNTEHQHHLHDDIVSLAHRTHDHQHLPLMQNQAPTRAHSCHAGDGHGHEAVSSTPAMGGGFAFKPMGGGGEHNHGSEVEHCPKCDEHMDGDSCGSCGYHEHHE